jgi:hypothetical protein
MTDECDFSEILYVSPQVGEQLELPLEGPQSPIEELDVLVFRAVADLPFSPADRQRMDHLEALVGPSYTYSSSRAHQ